jgi:hypothetical protein
MPSILLRGIFNNENSQTTKSHYWTFFLSDLLDLKMSRNTPQRSFYKKIKNHELKISPAYERELKENAPISRS